MPARATLAALALSLALCATATAAVVPATSMSTVGYDLSYPQCEAPAPALASFVIVGVDGGLANDANPCLEAQLTAAALAPGLKRPQVTGLQLYLDAADPGSGVPDWPSAAAGTAGVTPYGACAGAWSRSCAYLYGEQRALYSYGLAATLTTAAASAPWWIDVEIGASWAARRDSRGWAKLNVAAIRGYASGLRAGGARGAIGLYSNAYQWLAITALGARASRAYFPAGERQWVAGASTLAQARRACAKPFATGVVALAQFVEPGYDRDYACPSSRRAP